MNLQQLRQRLYEEGLLASPEGAAPPLQGVWYLTLISALGAWLATLFGLGFCLMLSNSESWLLALGLLLSGCAYALARQPVEFLAQLSLALWITGLSLLTMVGMWQFKFLSLLGASLLWALGALLFPGRQGQFLSFLGAGCLLLGASEDRHTFLPKDALVGLLALTIGGYAASQVYLWKRGWGQRLQPLATASLVVLMFTLWLSEWSTSGGAGAVSTALLGLATTWLTSRTCSRLQLGAKATLGCLLGVTLVAVSTLSAPGIMAGLALLILAGECKSHWWEAMGWLYLLGFTTRYLYEWSDSLNTKALVLLCLGGLLLLWRGKALAASKSTAL